MTLPQRTRRRRAKPKLQQQNRLKALPVDVAPKIFAFLAPGEAIRVAIRVEATDKTARSFTRYCFRELNTSAVDVKHGLSLMQASAAPGTAARFLSLHLVQQSSRCCAGCSRRATRRISRACAS